MIQIQPCKPEDVAILKRLRRQMLEEGYGIKPDSPGSQQLFDRTDAYLDKGEYDAVVAVEGDQVVGCASICYQSLIPIPLYPNGLRGYIQYVYVLPTHRRQGICRQMINSLLEQASRMDVREILLDATEMGRPVYEKIGFSQDRDTMIFLPKE